MFVGLSYLFLSLAALAFWRLEPSCISGACLEITQISFFLGRSWWLWGALFYACASALCLGLPKSRPVGAFLAAGALFHAGLIVYGYTATKVICPVCWRFAAAGALLAVSYWSLPKKWETKRLTAAPVILAVAVVCVLAVNPPVTKAAGHAFSEGRTVTDCLLCPQEGGIKQDAGRSTEPQKISDEASFKAGSGRYLKVTTPEGKESLLDLEKKSALFFAVWCPHCDEALKEAAKLGPEKRPYLVVTYLREGDAEKAKEKLTEKGLVGEEYYFAGSLPADLQGVPALIWMVGGKIESVRGAEAIVEKLRS